MKRTYTKIGEKEGYTPEEIDLRIIKTKWVDFRTTRLPFCQGEAIKLIIKECRIPLTKISHMDLHNIIKKSCGFYALNVKYSNGQAQIYIADNGCSTCVVASDFTKDN